MTTVRSRKPTVIPEECRVDLDELQRTAERCSAKCLLLEMMLTEPSSHYDQIQCFVMKQNLCEKAGRDGAFLWMHLPEFSLNKTDEVVRLLQKGLLALSIAARSTYEIWSSPFVNKMFQRESLRLLFQIQNFVEEVLESIAFEGDYDQILAKWWVWSNCETVGLTSLQLEDAEFTDEWRIDSLIASLFHLRGAAGLRCECEEQDPECTDDGTCPVL